MNEVLKVLHSLVGIWFVAGLIGRTVTIARARSSEDIRAVVALMDAAGSFERLMVIPGSMAVLVLGLLTMLAMGLPLTGEGSWWLLTALVLFLSLIPLLPLVFLPRGKVFEHAMQEAVGSGVVTPELRAAFADKVTAAARTYELAVVGVVVVLMIAKPF